MAAVTVVGRCCGWQPGAKVCYLISTFTYLAYANEHVPVEPVELFPFLATDAQRLRPTASPVCYRPTTPNSSSAVTSRVRAIPATSLDCACC